jgi:hypothetical protein
MFRTRDVKGVTNGFIDRCQYHQRAGRFGRRGFCRHADQGLPQTTAARRHAEPGAFQNPTFVKGLRRIIELPDGANAQRIRELLGPEGEDVVAHVTAT